MDNTPIDYKIVDEADHLHPVHMIHMQGHQYPIDIYRKTRDRMVIKWHLHKIAISRNQYRHVLYTSPSGTLRYGMFLLPGSNINPFR